MSLSLSNLVERLNDEQARKRDLVVPSSCLAMQDGKLAVFDLSSTPESLNALLAASGVAMDAGRKPAPPILFDPTKLCHSQISEKLQIPPKYYNRMKDVAVELLDENVNHWLRESRKNYFLRTFDSNNDNEAGLARSFLSDGYGVMDHLDILNCTLSAIRETGVKMRVDSADLTDARMYVRMGLPDVVVDAPKLLERYRVPGTHNFPERPYGVMSGLVFGNSETGEGGFFIAPRFEILACTNGLIVHSEAKRRVHLGVKMEVGIIEWSAETQNKHMDLIMSQVKDAVKNWCTKEFMEGIISEWTETGTKMLEHPVEAVKNVAKFYQFDQAKTDALLNYFIQGADTTGFGVSQAITYLAHEQDDADARYDLEAVGVEVIGKAKDFDYLPKKA